MFRTDLLKGKTILVTGGGSGLGKAMAERFSELGANIAIASRRMDLLEKVAEEISAKTGNRVFPVQLDVRNPLEVEKTLDKCIAEFGKIDGLVNNAAGNFVSPTERLSYNAFDVITNIVLRGTYYLTLALGKHWIKEKQAGDILNIVTTYAGTGSGYVVPSAVGKAGVVALTKSLAAEWGKYRIRLNAIAPGAFPTKGAWDRLFPDPKMAARMLDRIPAKRVGEHIELSNLASYLMSEESGYLTGDVITIDGGETVANSGQFNFLEELSPEQWDVIEKKVKENR